MIQKIDEIENSKIKSLFSFLCEDIETKLKTKTGKISKDREGNEKIKNSVDLKKEILENTTLFAVEKVEVENQQELSVNKIEIDETIAKIILSIYKNNFERTIIKHNYQIIDYDIEYELAKEHKIMKESKNNINKLNDITQKINNFNGCDQAIDFKKLSFFVIKVDFDGKNLFFFERFDNIMKLDKTRLMRLLSRRNEKKFNTVTGDFLYLKYQMPCYLFGDEMFILKKYVFEDIFDYSEKYKGVCTDKENIDFINNLDMCSNVKEFTDALDTDNMNVLRKFSKVMQEKEQVKKLFDDMNEIKKLLKEHNKLSSIVIENGKINVKKSNFQSVLKLMNRDHLKHQITKENFESNSKTKD